MNRTQLAALTLLCSLTACASYHEAMHPAKKKEETQLYLTLLPVGDIALNKATEIDTKLTQIKTRALITSKDMDSTEGGALPLIALDSSFTDFQTIPAAPTKVDGLYHFSFTPHLRNSYRIWAYAALKGAGAPEYPFKDIGTHTSGNFNRTEQLSQTLNGTTYTLKLESPLKRFNEDTLALEAKDAQGNPVPATIKNITGIYDDYRTVIRITPESGKDLTYVPDKEGYIKLFTRISDGSRETVVAFTVSVARD